MTIDSGKLALIAGVLILQAAGLLFLVVRFEPGPPQPPAAPHITIEAAEPRPIPRVDVLPDRPRTPLAGGGWRVIHQLSAHYILVVEVETEQMSNTRAIAQTLIEPVKDSYVEVLVYFHRPGTHGRMAAKRVQWTKAGGYVEMDYENDG